MFKNYQIKSLGIISIIFLILFSIFILGLGADTKQAKNKKEEIFLPIIMYHSVLKDQKLQNNYTISPALFENDLKFLNDNGYTTITVKDLTEYVFQGKELPKQCVMLTFDDGYYNNYYYVYPLLKKYKCKAVISPIASMTEQYSEMQNISVSYGHITTDDIKEMVTNEYVEIQNHSYDMHTLKPREGVARKRGESFETYKKVITDDITKAQNYLKKAAGTAPSCFVYPFGAKSEGTEKIIKELGFVCTMTCTEKPNIITRNPESLFELGRYRRDGNESMETLIKQIKK